MKRVLCAFLILIMTIGMMMSAVLPVSAETAAAGDVNADGKVNSLDALVAMRLIAGQSYTGTVNQRGLFVNGDALANTADLVQLLRYASANWDVTLSAPAADETVVHQPVNNTYYIESKAIRIVNQNILHGGGGNNAMNAKKPYRMKRMELLMEKYDPDICTLQEYRWSDWYELFEETIFPIHETSSTPSWWPWPGETTPAEYEAYIASRVDLSLNEVEGAGSSAEQPLMIDERSAIFWKNDRFDLCKDSSGKEIKGQFWFSETPNVSSPGYMSEELTVSEDGLYYDGRQRQTIWVKLKELSTGNDVYVLNVHGLNASDKQAAQICTFTMQTIVDQVKLIMAKYGEAAVIVTGDFNVDYYNKADALAIATMEAEYTDVGKLFNDMQGTFPAWGRNVDDNGFIPVRGDIFYVKDPSRAVPVYHHVMEDTFDADYNIIPSGFGGFNENWVKDADDRYNGYWVSDHLGLCAEFVIA